jgi:hypothetical protein
MGPPARRAQAEMSEGLGPRASPIAAVEARNHGAGHQTPAVAFQDSAEGSVWGGAEGLKV